MIRKSKIAALMLVAASISSMIPGTAMAATSDTVKSIKGQIYDAVAYKDGRFYIAGEPKSKDEGAYYFHDGTYKELKDIDSDDKINIVGSSYISVNDGDYYVDLSTGKVDDKNIEESEKDDASVALRNNIKSDNDGRYDSLDAKEVKDVKVLPAPKFSEGWYGAQYKPKEASDSLNGGAEALTVYTNKKGKYIDADYNLGKIKVKLSNSKTATIENTNKADQKVSGSVSNTKVIGQDSSNIYRLAKITLKVSDTWVTIKSVNGLELDDKTNAIEVSDNGSTVSFDVIQVISKNQSSSKIDGIKYAKNVTSYILADRDGKKIDLLNDSEDGFTVADGKLINYKIDSKSVEAEIIELKSKNSFNYINRGNRDTVNTSSNEGAVDIDTNGNLWVLTDGYIRKFDNDEDFEKVYTIDEDYDNLSVYDKDNIVVWSGSDNVYAVIGGTSYDDVQGDIIDNGSGSTNGSGNSSDNNNNSSNNNNNNNNNNSSVKPGWAANSETRTWTYIDSDGSTHKGWLSLNGVWYYMDPSTGIMQTGWKKINGTWYYMQSSGEMKTGWLLDGGNWYYLHSSGAMATGWVNNNGTWYYCDNSGKMLSNTTIDGYRLGSNGAWIK